MCQETLNIILHLQRVSPSDGILWGGINKPRVEERTCLSVQDKQQQLNNKKCALRQIVSLSVQDEQQQLNNKKCALRQIICLSVQDKQQQLNNKKCALRQLI